jgi:hypothetical protein
MARIATPWHLALAAASLALALLEPIATASLDLRIICEPCDDESDCGDQTDLCLTYPGVGSFCGMHCIDDGDCAGLSCEETSIDELSQCVDVEGYCRGGPPFECYQPGHCSPGQDCVQGRCVDLEQPLGGACVTDADCTEGTCRDTSGGRVCTRECDWSRPVGGDCPAGLFCDTNSQCTLGLCAPGAPGESASGTACESPLDCADLFCADSPDGGAATCAVACDPTLDACPAGSHCEAAAGSCGTCQADCEEDSECPSGLSCIRGVCLEPQPDGAACDDGADCASGVCTTGVCGRDDGGDDGGPDPDGGTGVGRLGSGCGCATPGTSGAPSAVRRLLDLTTGR